MTTLSSPDGEPIPVTVHRRCIRRLDYGIYRPTELLATAVDLNCIFSKCAGSWVVTLMARYSEIPEHVNGRHGRVAGVKVSLYMHPLFHFVLFCPKSGWQCYCPYLAEQRYGFPPDCWAMPVRGEAFQCRSRNYMHLGM
jgi:hypothetical protein